MGKIYFTCSFDDGDVHDLRLADLLSKYGIRATFYIPRSCDLVFKSLSENQIKDLSQSFEIGGHTLSHQVLTYVNDKKAHSEILECKAWLEQVVGKPVTSFCPPTGRFNKNHIAFQKEAGYTIMRTVEMLSYDLRKIKKKNEFVILPTTLQVFNHTRVAYVKNSLKRLNLSSYPVFKKMFDPNWETMSGNYIYYLNMESTTPDHYFHLWGHSWEIEKYSLWNSLEQFFKKMNDVNGVVYCNNSEIAEIIRNKRNEQ